MLSLGFLFERSINEPLPRAEPVTTTRDNYINERRATLKQAFSRGRINAKDYAEQLKYFLKNKYDKAQGYYLK